MARIEVVKVLSGNTDFKNFEVIRLNEPVAASCRLAVNSFLVDEFMLVV